MKKLLIPLLLVVMALPASADVIYDTITGATGWSYTSGLPRNREADGMSGIAPPSGQYWEVTQIDTILIVAAAVNYTNVTAQVKVWDEWNSAGWGGAGTNVFQSLANQTLFTLGPVSTTGVTAYNVSFTYATPFALADELNFGIEIQWLADGVKTDNLTIGIRDTLPSVGTGTNLFYRDADNDEVIETTDGRVITGWANTNLGLRVTANAVPEPASLLLLALGTLVLRRR